MANKITLQTHVSKNWTEKRVQSLIKYFGQYNGKRDWSTKISKRMRTFTSDAIYKKASRMGLVNPLWATKEKDVPGKKKTVRKGR